MTGVRGNDGVRGMTGVPGGDSAPGNGVAADRGNVEVQGTTLRRFKGMTTAQRCMNGKAAGDVRLFRHCAAKTD